MAGTSVYDALVRFVGDLTDVDKSLAGIQTTAGQAGTASGQSFGTKFGGVIKTTIGAIAGAGIGVLLKAVTDGAVELDAATRKYAADTGATVEETKLAGQQINELFRTNTDNYATIGDVLSKIATDLHITGTEAEAAAQSFLNYAKATGQEPVAATNALTVAIKAWQVPASQIPALMDAIVRGHQLYGGSVEDNVAALAKLAPALTAANFTVSDGLGLLNLFAAAGLDSAKASVAFQTALTKVKSPEQLTKLIAQIQATPDDFDRAKLAIALFGTRAGAQLAAALAPGSKSIADYTVTAQDSVGATDAAAAAIDQGFGNQVVMAFHNVEGSLSGLAQNVQPVVDVLDALGNMGVNVLPLLGTSLGALAPKLVPIGMTMGEAIQSGMLIGMTVGLGVLVVGAIKSASDWAQSQMPGGGLLGSSAWFGGNGSPGTTSIAIQAKDSLVWTADMIDKDPYLPAAGVALGANTAAGLASGYQGGAPTFGKALDDTALAVQIFGGRISRSAATTAAEMMASFQSMVSAWAAQWSELDAIATAAVADIYGAQDRAAAWSATQKAIADQKIILSSKTSTAAQKADAEAQLLTLTETSEKEQIVMAGHGELTKTQYATLITTLNKQATSSNEEVATAAKLALAELAKLKTAADDTAAALAQVKVYGGNGTTKKNAAGGYLAAGETSLVNELGQELFAPTGSYFTAPMDGYVIPAGPSAAIMAGAGSGPAAAGGRQAPYIGEQHIYGIQPDEVEVQTKRAIRRATLETQLAGGRA